MGGNVYIISSLVFGTSKSTSDKKERWFRTVLIICSTPSSLSLQVFPTSWFLLNAADTVCIYLLRPSDIWSVLPWITDACMTVNPVRLDKRKHDVHSTITSLSWQRSCQAVRHIPGRRRRRRGKWFSGNPGVHFIKHLSKSHSGQGSWMPGSKKNRFYKKRNRYIGEKMKKGMMHDLPWCFMWTSPPISYLTELFFLACWEYEEETTTCPVVGLSLSLSLYHFLFQQHKGTSRPDAWSSSDWM